jgi:ectoine hydroxylase-related dioxygenase (phytanoyl-CoA dioxygenase family)
VEGLRPFVDSTGIAGDGKALAARMARDGYLFVRGLVPPAEVAAVREDALAVVAEAGWLSAERARADAIANPRAACADPDDRYVPVLRRLYRREALHALKHHPAVVGLFESMLGEDVLVHPMLIVRNIFPQRPELTTPSHQDFPHIQGTAETFAMWLPLSDCPTAMGGLTVAESSHAQGVREFRASSGAGAMEVCDPLDGRWVGGDFAQGDAVIFHSMTVHRALPNTTDRLRQSIDARYQRLSEPVSEKSLDPYAGTGTWDEIYRGWRREDLQYYWRELPLTFAPFDWQYYERRDQLAFEMAAEGDREARAALLRIIQRDPDPAKRDRAAHLVATLDRA